MSEHEVKVMTAGGRGGRKRTGTCGWCGRHKAGLRYTVWVEGGAYHAANICEICLREYRESLREKVTAGNG